MDDFFEYKSPEDWQRSDNFTNRALRDMLRANGVYIQKEKGPNTISKHLANLVLSTDFPEWDKNDRDYAKVAHILEPFPGRIASPHKNTADDANQSEPTQLMRFEYPSEDSANASVFMQPQQYTSRQKGKDIPENDNNKDCDCTDNAKFRDGLSRNNPQQNRQPTTDDHKSQRLRNNFRQSLEHGSLSANIEDQNQILPQKSPPSEPDKKTCLPHIVSVLIQRRLRP